MTARIGPDHTDRQILRFRRARAERQEVLYGDAGPQLCRQGDALVLCGRGGSLAISNDGGAAWSQLPDLAAPETAGGAVLALAARADGTLAAAVERQGAVLILCADQAAGPWRLTAAIDAGLAASGPAASGPAKSGPAERESDEPASTGPAPDGGEAAEEPPAARLTPLAGGSLLLSLPGRILRSADAAAWEMAAKLPADWGPLHPLQLRSGRLVAPVADSTGAVALAESVDAGAPGGGGADWRVPDGFAPLAAELAELPDGRLALTYGMPHFPYGARAVIGAPDGGPASGNASVAWGDEVYVLGLCRYAIREKARPVLAGPGAGAAAAVTGDGVIVSAFHRGAALGSYAPTIYGPGMDEWGRRPAIGVVRWTPEGLDRPPLVYPNLWTERTDARGYLDNGMVRMRPDDRYEGGDYVENFEMVVYRRAAAEQRYFPGAGAKGVVVCRHPDGSLVYTSRDHRIHRSTDEGLTWSLVAEVPLSGRQPSVFGFGVTGEGTFLLSYAVLIDPADPARGAYNTHQPRVARSDDGGRTWTDAELAPRPTRYCGLGDGSRIVQVAGGTVIACCSNAWNDAARQAGYEGDVLLRSHDDGRTWGDWTVLPPGSCESNLLELPSGELLCATRYQREYLSVDLFDAPAAQGGGRPEWPAPSRNRAGPGRFKNEAVMFSADGGYAWTTPFLVTRLHMCSADAVLLPDGRVALTYDHKDAVGGPRALVSPDGGRTWGDEHYILAYHRMDARTSSVTLRDGRVLTLWAGARDDGIHATTWSPGA